MRAASVAGVGVAVVAAGRVVAAVERAASTPAAAADDDGLPVLDGLDHEIGAVGDQRGVQAHRLLRRGDLLAG